MGVSWSSGSCSVKSTAEDEPDVGRPAEVESGRRKGSPLTVRAPKWAQILNLPTTAGQHPA